MIASQGTRLHQRLLTRSYRGLLLVLLLCVSILNFMDRAILSAAVEPMRRELQLTDGQIGLLQGLAFGIVYALASIPIGRLAERMSRKHILIGSTLFFSAMSALCGWASSFAQLFVLRAGVGVGEAAFLPPTTSLLADHYPAARRASAMSIVSLGSPLGYLIGSIVGGAIVTIWGWRMAFYLTAIPGAIVALLLAVALVEPPRGLVDGAIQDNSQPAPSLRTVLSYLSKLPTFRYCLIGGTFTLFGSYGISHFLFSFFVRSLGLLPSQAGTATGLISFFSIGGGLLLGGYGSDWLRRFDVRWSAWMPTIGIFISALFYVFGLLSTSLAGVIVGTTLGGMALFCFYAPMYATVQNLCPPRMRATAISVLALVFGLVAAGFGPTLGGALSDMYAAFAFHGERYAEICQGGIPTAALRQACDMASANGLRFALATMCGFFVVGSFCFWAASFTIRADLERTQ